MTLDDAAQADEMFSVLMARKTDVSGTLTRERAAEPDWMTKAAEDPKPADEPASPKPPPFEPESRRCPAPPPSPDWERTW